LVAHNDRVRTESAAVRAHVRAEIGVYAPLCDRSKQQAIAKKSREAVRPVRESKRKPASQIIGITVEFRVKGRSGSKLTISVENR
jgi:hypothetical protein